MPFVAIPQVSKVTLRTSPGGTPCFNTFWLHTSFVADAADVAYLADHIGTLVETDLSTIWANGVPIDSLEVVAQDTSSAPSSVNILGAGGSGGTGGPAPLNCCKLASMHVATRYRGGHSRLYFSGAPTSTLDGPKNWNALNIGFLQGHLIDFVGHVNALTPPSGATVEVGTVHHRRGGVTLTPPEFEAWVGVTMSTAVTTQRRRLRG